MGSAQSIPIVGEVVTAVEAGGKALAGGVCALVGEEKASKELLDGARRSVINFTEVNPMTANICMLVAHINNDEKTVEHLKETQRKAWTDVAENTPVVGHVAGICHYAAGNPKAGDRAMFGASRSTAVVLATVATGGAGAIACGAAALGAGLAVDGVGTGVNSLVQKDFAPLGSVDAVKRACDSGSANDIFDAISGPAADAAGGALHGAMKGVRGQYKLEKTTPAKTLADRYTGRPSRLERYQRFVESGHPQATMVEVVETGPHTVLEFSSPVEAMRNLEVNTNYNFVRLPDGRIRAMSHADAVQLEGRLGKPVGHTSLVEPGSQVIAAGELHFNGSGILHEINAQSGHYRLPLDRFTAQIGKVFPRSVIRMKPQAAVIFAAHTTSTFAACSAAMKKILCYSPSLALIVTAKDDIGSASLAKSTAVLAIVEKGSVSLTAFCNRYSAEIAYAAVPNGTRVLISRTTPSLEVLDSRGADDGVVEKCKDCIRNSNFIGQDGKWQQTLTDMRTWRDQDTDKFYLRYKSSEPDGSAMWILRYNLVRY